METPLEAALDLLEISADERDSICEDISFHAEVLRVALATPPVRIKQLVSMLNQIEELSAQLAHLVEHYDADAVQGIGSFAYQYSGDGFSTALLLSDIVSEDDLKLLSRRSGSAAGTIVRNFGSGDPDKPDPGGAAIEIRLFGTPKRRFVKELVWIWAGHRPDALSETPGGLLHQFCGYCWEWAVGENSPLQGLDDDLRLIVPVIRRRTHLRNVAFDCDLIAQNIERVGRTEDARPYRDHACRIFELLAQGDDELLCDLPLEVPHFDSGG